MRSGVCMKEVAWELKQDLEAQLSVDFQKDELWMPQVAQIHTVLLLALRLWHLDQVALRLTLRQKMVVQSWHRESASAEAVRMKGLLTLAEHVANPLQRVCAASHACLWQPA